MSFDTTQRINDYFDSQVGTPNELYTIHLDKNENIPDDLGGGVFVKLSTEASFDELTGSSRPDELFTERGIVIVEIIAPVGLGTADPYSLERVVSLVRDAFRGKFLNPTGSQEGFIYFEDISTARSFELPSRMDGDYLVKNVFINYQKNYTVGAAPTEIPVNVSIPVISGTFEIGELLTTTNGTWTNSPTSFTYKWLRDDVAISGATSQTYTTVSADGDAVIKSEVVATNIIGPSLAAESVGSSILGLPVNTAIPVVTGDTDEGDLLTTTTGTWTNTPTSFTYRWLRDDVAISGATSSTYTIVAADVGTTLKSEVTAINGSGTSAAAESVGTAIPSGAIQRNFTTLDAAFSMNYSLTSTVTLTGDYKLSDKIQLGASGNLHLFGRESVNAGRLIISNTTGLISWRPESSSTTQVTATIPALDLSKLNTIEAERVGSNGTIKVNGAELFNGSVPTGSLIIDTFGRTAFSNSNGIIADQEITDAGTLIHSWELGEDWIANNNAIDSIGGNTATAVNIDSDDAENFTFNGAVSPNTWTNDGATIIIEVAGT